MTAITVNQSYYLEVNSVALACPAWRVVDPFVVLDDAGVRGSNRVMPGASGQRALKRVRDAQVVTLALEVVGNFDSDGTPAADPAAKLVTHLDYLRANLGFAKSTGDGTVTVVFHRGGASSLTTTAHFLGFKGGAIKPPAYYLTTFDLSIPSGVWT